MNDIYEDILKLKTSGGSGVLITVVEKEGHGPAAVGTKMLVMADGSRKGTVGGGALEYTAVKRAETVQQEGKGGLIKYLLSPDNQVVEGEDIEKTGMVCGGSTTLFYEAVGSGAKLFLLGAGHVGQALAYHLRHLNYYITAIDSRNGLVEQMEGVQRRFTVGNYEQALDQCDVPQGSFFIVATHSHALDYMVLKKLYETNLSPKYIGLIASIKKAPLMKKRLQEELGPALDFSALYSPMGLHIGGTLPHEIAISVIAELQAVRYSKTGHVHMKNR